MSNRLSPRIFIGTMIFVAGLVQVAFAQSLTITSPASGDFLGRANQVKFLAENVTSQAKIVVTTTSQANSSTTFRTEALFDPDSNNKISGSVDINFDEATPTGLYDIKVEYFSQNNLVTTRNITGVSIDTKTPKFKNISPLTGAFVKGIVPILAELDEANVDLWTVKVNSRDIPNNSGNSTIISATWDTSLIERDGQQTIAIDVKDRGRNSSNRSQTVTLDRVSPTTSIRSPSSIGYRPGAIIPVQIDIDDQFDGALKAQGVTVTLKTMDGQFIQSVSRRAVRQNGRSIQWVGRIRPSRNLPTTFKMIVQVLDRAGNAAVTQEVTVRYGI